MACTTAFAASVADNSSREKADLQGRYLTGLLVPFSLAYAVLLAPRALRDLTIDRYLLPLVAVALLLALRVFQGPLRRNLPRWSMGVAGVVAIYSVLTLQDAFGMYRAVVRAGNELEAAGIARAAFDGGWEYDGLTQIAADGYMHQNGIRMPAGERLLYGHRRRGPCALSLDPWIPSVVPEYTLSYNATGCGGATGFPPVSYTRWLSPHKVELFIVKDPDLSGKHGLFATF